MHLDMLTMSAVDITATVVLGLVLVFTWIRQAGTPMVAWWGAALLVQAAGITFANASWSQRISEKIVTFGLAAIVLSDALKWSAAREFAGRRTNYAWALLGPAAFLIFAYFGHVDTIDGQFVLLCAMAAICCFGAAFELSRDKAQGLISSKRRLISHWPVVALLTFVGIACLSWVPLAAAMPLQDANAAFLSRWFPIITLFLVLVRIALAFAVLATTKERQEMEQRAQALTDSLTGLPNRRALYESVEALENGRVRDSISVLLFDLDHFKAVNDTFGHAMGDRVLKLFAAVWRNALTAVAPLPAWAARNLPPSSEAPILPQRFRRQRPCGAPLPSPLPLSTAFISEPR
jgi:Diguanylate cyclase, GGDEF domain